MTISILAPHEGERRACRCILQAVTAISILAPHEGERRSGRAAVSIAAHYFNPRSPRGGATYTYVKGFLQIFYFNPRSPRGGATDT